MPTRGPAKPAKQSLILTRSGYAELLADELRDRWQITSDVIHRGAVAVAPEQNLPPLATLVFGRQLLPQAVRLEPHDLAAAVVEIRKKLAVAAQRANRQTGNWTLHVFGLDDDPAVQFAVKLEKALLADLKQKLPAFCHRYLTPDAFLKESVGKSDFIVQVFVMAPDQLWLSVGALSGGVVPLIAGNLRLRDKAGSPSRSARKLEEAFLALGRSPRIAETAVDLGAAPGGWTFTLARHGATVTAVDHGALDLPDAKNLLARVHHLKDNGLKYQPAGRVDWLCCDMLINPRETLRVLSEWLANDRMNHFVVNIKLPQAEPWPVIREAVDLMQQSGWHKTQVKHLYHDRREVTLLGSKQAQSVG